MRLLIAILVIALTTVAPVAADGKYFARAEVSNDPTIPAQRAIVRFVDGEQTLVVESMVRSEERELGWIIPVPSPPSALQAMTPGTIETLDQLMAPRIETGSESKFLMQLLGAIAFLVAWLCLAHVAKWSSNHLVVVLGVFLAVTFLIAVLLPAVGRARGFSDVRGVEVLSAERVGAYDTAILEATAGDDVVRWLKDNGFSASPDSVATFHSYVGDGWSFVVARLAKGEADQVQPHPLAITFATNRAVYPMRLTAVTTQPLQLDLFVIAKQEARVEQLDTWRVERLKSTTLRHALGHDVPGFESKESSLRLGHPALVTLLFDGCAVTRLRGELAPEKMRTDFDIHFVDGNVRSKRLYTRSGALRHGILIGLGILPFIWLGATAIVRKRPKSIGAFLRTAMSASASVFGLVMLGSVAFLPIVQATVTVEHPIQRFRLVHELHYALRAYVKDYLDTPFDQFMKSEEYVEHLALENAFLDVPCSCTIDPTDDGGWLVVVYDVTGAPAHHRITRFGKLTIDEQPEYGNGTRTNASGN